MSSWWPLIRLLPIKTNFEFVRFAGFAAFASIALVLASFASFATAGFTRSPAQTWASSGPSAGEKGQAFFCAAFNCGVDFQGGTLLEVSTPGRTAPLAELRTQMAAIGLPDTQVQGFGSESSALLRFESPEGQDPAKFVDTVKAELRARMPDVQIARAEVVGPKVSGELFASGLTALGLAILLMLIYIWFRFELNYGVGAVIALFHDVILTMGLLSVLRMEFSLTSIAALLTIIGYSMNDTVVVFDRMRENRRKLKRMSWRDLIDLSVNETLSRTVITGCTALLALGGLMFLGGPTMFPFVFAMMFGIIIGTYSSIYVAAPAMLVSSSPVKPGPDTTPDAEPAASTGG
ncbi:MAG: protein translocase subunit SecF [Alphaproteobacteria bacterium]|nr:protein translocase subunit SecF [Alphaproteobacteria bacterium]